MTTVGQPHPPGSEVGPDPRFPYGALVAALTESVRSSGPREVAALLHQVLDANDGLLARTAEFFDATAARARAYDKNDGDDDAFYLAGDLADTAVRLRRLGEVLHVAPERMADLLPAPGHTTPSSSQPLPAPPPHPPSTTRRQGA
ncbi:hypothetical protein SLA_7152 [Streptomyces laurentii]|uniref:Uncharacterized protein n=1 Tax=Streptomyces laurentii TaxID=39478 RepID=A0A169PIX7_STRLU|nr:hypothetical protein SLA_7152 [Streptomyces laurentii]